MLPPVCDACARAPAALFFKADSASLCAAEIHSANPLACRHHHVAIVTGVNYGVGMGAVVEEVDEAASWVLLNPVKNNDIDSLSYGIDDPASFCGVVDEYLNLGDSNNNPCQNNTTVDHDQFNFNHNDDVARSGGDDSSHVGYNYWASMSHAVSFSTLDVGVVPEESTMMSENSSISHTRPLAQMPTQLGVMDREARVLRYREKKNARKFEKTIRYASRPRIKGRFVRRASVADFEVDQLFSASLLAEAAGFGIVPPFEV